MKNLEQNSGPQKNTVRIYLIKSGEVPKDEEIDKMERQLEKLITKLGTYEGFLDWCSHFIKLIQRQYGYKNQKNISMVTGVTEPTLSKIQTKKLKQRALLKYIVKIIPSYLVSLYYNEVSDPQFILSWRSHPLMYDYKSSGMNSYIEVKSSHFVCYRWKFSSLAISFLEIFTDSKAVYSIYKMSEEEDNSTPSLLFRQYGTARFIGNNIEISLYREDSQFSTYILFFIGPAYTNIKDLIRSKDDSNNKVHIGSYVTTSEKGRPTAGSMVLRKIASEEEGFLIFNKYHHIQNIRNKSLHEPTSEEDYKSLTSEKDLMSDQISTFLHNRRLSTDAYNLPRNLEEPVPFMSNSKQMSTFAGIYDVFYWHQEGNNWKRIICQILPNGAATIIDKIGEKFNKIEGFIRYTNNGKNSVLIGKFDYTEAPRLFRFFMVLNIGEIIVGNRYTFKGDFIYSGQGHYPRSGYIDFVQKDSNYLKVSDALEDFEQEPTNEYAFLSSVRNTESIFNTYGNIERFVGVYECYALSSSTNDLVVEMFPIKINRNGTVEMKSRNSIYIGRASLFNDFLSIIFTHKEDGPATWKHLLFKVDGLSRDDVKYAVGLGTRNNRKFQLRCGLEVLIPSRHSFDYELLGFMDCINNFFATDINEDEKKIINIKVNNKHYGLSEAEEIFSSHKPIFQAVTAFLYKNRYITNTVSDFQSKDFNNYLKLYNAPSNLTRI